MDDADHPSAGSEAEPGVLGNLPTTRPQHRSSRRASSAPASTTTRTGLRSAGPAPLPPGHRSTTKPTAAPAGVTADSEPRPTPDVLAPPPAPRSGWATPQPDRAPTTPLPPLVALADGAVRTGAQLLRGVLRRLPGG